MDRQGVAVARHAGILMGMEISIGLLDALVSVILARYLAPQGFGLLAFALSFASLFGIIPGFGMGSMSLRDVARHPEHLSQYVSNGLIAKLALAAVTLVAIGLGTAIAQFPADKTLIVLLAGVFMILDTNVRYTLSFFQAAQRMSTVAVVNLAVHLGWVILSLAVVGLRAGVVELLAVRVLVTAVGLVASVVLIDRRLQRIAWTFDVPFVWHLMKASFPFALFRLKHTLYTDIDTVMLSAMRGDVMTGWYAAANKLLRVFRFIPTGAFGAILPAMARSSRDSQADLSEALSRSCKYLAIIGLPIAGGACVLANELVLWLFGSAYQPAALALQLISWSLLFEFLNSATVAGIAAVNRERQGSRYLIVGALFSGLSNLVVVPLFGHLGAAATTVMTESLVFVLQVRLLRQAIPQLNLLSQLIRPIAVTAVMMAFAGFSRPAGLAWAIPLSAAVYVGGLIVTRTIGSREWSLLNGMLRMKTADEHA